MKKIILILTLSALCSVASAQFIAKMKVQENISGLCNKDEVYALLPGLKGQEKAVCPVTPTELLTKLNAEVVFIQDKPDYEDAGMVSIILNCRGETVHCKMDNKTQNSELDGQIEAVFNSLGKWKPGKLNKRNVDSVVLVSFTIVKGVFALNHI